MASESKVKNTADPYQTGVNLIPNPTSGDLLIAPPGIPDKRFHRSVLMLTHDHDGGAFALCVNKPSHYTLIDVLEDIGVEANLNFPLYWGGPVSPTTIWMLHSSEWSTEHTVPVNDDWSMTSNVEMFHCLADGDFPLHFRIMFGYCAWSQGQLRAELTGREPWNVRHSWLVAQSPDGEWLFEQPIETLWEEATQLSSNQAVDSWL